MTTPLIAHHYNREVASLVESVGSPLFHNFGITHFGLVKVNSSRLMVRLANHDDWNRVYTNERFYNDMEVFNWASIPINGVRKKILTGDPVSKHEKILYEHHLWNFLLLYERSETEGGMCFFGTSPDNRRVIDYYINYPNVFEHFVFYFKQQLSHYLKFNKKQCIELSIDPLGIANSDDQALKDFYKHTKVNRFYLNGAFRNITLSKREAECIFYLARGQTTKDVAKNLNLSHRTVESFINNIRLKTDIQSKSELVQKLFSMAPNFGQSTD